jgi:two-component system chemotaxis response regulator CheB
MRRNRKIRVLIVDDSAIVRKILSSALAGEPDLEVVGTAPDPYVARDQILALEPDVLTLDIEMPRMDGLTFLRKLMRYHPMPAVVISSLALPACEAALKAFEYGAVEVMAKPGGPYSVAGLGHTLAQKLRAAASARLPQPAADQPVKPLAPIAPASGSRTLIAIGASTGGTEAIGAILTRLPADTPPIVVVQHIPSGFSRAFANRLNEICAFRVQEAADGDEVRPGLALIAPGDFHMVLRRASGRRFVNVKTGPQICYQRPSVDVLFHSVAETAVDGSVGVLLTGMGRDGAEGLLRLRQAGAHTIAQDEASCVIFGMPREAIRRGAAAQVLPLDRIAHAMLAG